MKLIFGADPELFVFSHKENRFISAHDIIPGTKDSPFVVEGGAIQHDGVAAEFNINPSTDYDEFGNNLIQVLSHMETYLPDDCYFVPIPYAWFGEDYLNSLPPEVRELGCSPDMNAYTMTNNVPPDSNVGFRTCGGHIHVGWGEGYSTDDPDHIEACAAFVRKAEQDLYNFSYLDPRYYVELNGDKFANYLRRDFYGDYGAMRVKPYGVEFRSFSNSWLAFSKHRIKFILYGIQKSFDSLMHNYEMVDGRENFMADIDTFNKKNLMSNSLPSCGFTNKYRPIIEYGVAFSEKDKENYLEKRRKLYPEVKQPSIFHDFSSLEVAWGFK